MIRVQVIAFLVWDGSSVYLRLKERQTKNFLNTWTSLNQIRFFFLKPKIWFPGLRKEMTAHLFWTLKTIMLSMNAFLPMGRLRSIRIFQGSKDCLRSSSDGQT